MIETEKDSLLLAEKAYQKLRMLLTHDGLRAGQFISMPDLVKLMGYPMAPTREAVKRAAAGELVSVVPKRGVLVMEVTPTAIRECFDLRTIFDQEGARRLVRNNAPKDDIIALRAKHQSILERARQKVTAEVQSEAKQIDWSMHLTLGNSMDNASAKTIYSLNKDKIIIIQQSRPFLPERIVSAMEEHIEILDAILEGDEDKAAFAVREHYRHTLRWWGIII